VTAYKSAPPRYCRGRLTAGRGEPVNLAGGLGVHRRDNDIRMFSGSKSTYRGSGAWPQQRPREIEEEPARHQDGGHSPWSSRCSTFRATTTSARPFSRGRNLTPASLRAQTQNSAALWGSGLSSCPFCKCYSALIASSLVLISGFSCRTMFNKDLWTSIVPLYSMKPNLRNLFMKKLTRDRVVPIISASIS
jgi:hypothetical protein